ncbi:MAG: AEC family transporter [Bacteroidota bacterium]
MKTQIIIEQIIVLGILIMTGAIGAWTRVINATVKESIARLVFNITLPLLIITTFMNMEISGKLLKNGLWVLIFSNIAIFIMWGVGNITLKWLKIKPKVKSIHLVHTMFGNIVFLGFPLIDAMFPKTEALLYAALYYLVSTYIMWTIGITILQKDGSKKDLKHQMKNLFNPNTIAFFIGLIFMLFQVKVPELAYNALKGIGKTTIYLSMLYIGSVLATTPIKGIFKRYDTFILSLNKLIIVPIILILLIKWVTGMFNIAFDEIAQTIVIIETAMPCMTLIVILAKNYGADDVKAVEHVFVTTILSLFTLPFIYYLIGVI